jgi:hypothetical protein
MAPEQAVRVVPDGPEHASLVLGFPGGGEVGLAYGTRAEMRAMRDMLVHFLGPSPPAPAGRPVPARRSAPRPSR